MGQEFASQEMPGSQVRLAGAERTGGTATGPGGNLAAWIWGEIPLRLWYPEARGGSLLYVSVPAARSPAPAAKLSLAARLCARFRRDDPGAAPRTVNLVTDSLGKPRLLAAGTPAPAFSLSHGAGRTWAALCGHRWDLGIDATHAGEFGAGYPYFRVFHPWEFQEVGRLTGGRPPEAAALLWSVKEAVVKALGCGFHFFGPREIKVEPTGAWDDGHILGASLAIRPGEPPPFKIPVMVRRQGDAWLAAALAPREALRQSAWWRRVRGRRP